MQPHFSSPRSLDSQAHTLTERYTHIHNFKKILTLSCSKSVDTLEEIQAPVMNIALWEGVAELCDEQKIHFFKHFII